jgi:hypothetical protein
MNADVVALSDLMAQFEAVDMPLSAEPDMARAACWYVKRFSWPIFPVHHFNKTPSGLRCSCGKDRDELPIAERCKSPGKHPMTWSGFKDASADLETVKAWWSEYPRANIGTPTGVSGCGLDVIDIDGPEGMETWLAWRSASPESIPPLAALAFTPGNRKRKAGRHWLTPAVGTTNTTRALPGIDLRGDGGYILLPPSQGATGGRYQWILQPGAST